MVFQQKAFILTFNSRDGSEINECIQRSRRLFGVWSFSCDPDSSTVIPVGNVRQAGREINGWIRCESKTVSHPLGMCCPSRSLRGDAAVPADHATTTTTIAIHIPIFGI